jgi:hypothetical protein
MSHSARWNACGQAALAGRCFWPGQQPGRSEPGSPSVTASLSQVPSWDFLPTGRMPVTSRKRAMTSVQLARESLELLKPRNRKERQKNFSNEYGGVFHSCFSCVSARRSSRVRASA